MASHKPHAQPPADAAPGTLRITEPEDVAAGWPSVVNVIRHARRKAGLSAGAKLLARVNQKDGFDCPSCAWPDPDGERSIAEFCENGAKAVVDEADRRSCDPAVFARHTLTELSEHSDQWLNERGRITHPMVKRPGKDRYEAIAWEDAFRLIAEHLNGLEGPDEATFYTSGRTSNETAFLYQAFVREYGTNNLPDCSNMCHESSGKGLSEVIGIGKGTVTLDCFRQTDVIVIIGQNPGTNHPRMLSSLEEAKRNGARIISINPLPEAGLMRFKQPQDYKHPVRLMKQIAGEGTSLSDLYLPVRVNGDVAVLKGLAKALLEREASEPGSTLRLAFIDEKTHGFDNFAEDVRSASWEVIVEEGGVDEASLRAAAEMLAQADRGIYCWAMVLTQHANGVANIQMVANLAFLRAHIGRPGAGLCPVRGHSNVQGDRTMGIWDKPSATFLDRLESALGFAPPRKHGFDTVESIKAMHDGRLKVFVGLGGNFLSATPDTEFTAEALRRCDLTVQISTKLNRAHLVTGSTALILPCLGRTERDVHDGVEQFMSCENSMGIVQKTQGRREPPSPWLLSEPAIVAGMAAATLGDRARVDYSALARDYDRIRDLIAAVIPGCDDYNRRVRAEGGFYLPNAARDGEFRTDIGKARFTVHEIPRHRLGDQEFMLMTMRSHDQFNTTVYGTDDRYRGIRGGRRVVLMHAQDMAERGFQQGDLVDVTSRFEGSTRTGSRFAVVPYPIPRKCLGAYFPEANVLVPVDHTAVGSNTPASKSVVVTLERSVSDGAAVPAAMEEDLVMR